MKIQYRVVEKKKKLKITAGKIEMKAINQNTEKII